MGLTEETPATGQVDFGIQMVVTHAKVRAEKTKQPETWDKTGAAGGHRQVGEKLGWAVMLKASEAKFPLLPLGVALTQGPRRKGKKAVEWEELVEWRYLAACHSPSVEHLRERFIGMKLRVAWQISQKTPPGPVNPQQLSQPHCLSPRKE